jgi:hypothetical protein
VIKYEHLRIHDQRFEKDIQEKAAIGPS